MLEGFFFLTFPIKLVFQPPFFFLTGSQLILDLESRRPPLPQTENQTLASCLRLAQLPSSFFSSSALVSSSPVLQISSVAIPTKTFPVLYLLGSSAQPVPITGRRSLSSLPPFSRCQLGPAFPASVRPYPWYWSRAVRRCRSASGFCSAALPQCLCPLVCVTFTILAHPLKY